MNQSGKHVENRQCSLLSFCSLLFSDEFPLDAIKSVHKCPLKPHNYRKKKRKISILIERSSGGAWEPIREAPAQTESEAVQSCSAAH